MRTEPHIVTVAEAESVEVVAVPEETARVRTKPRTRSALMAAGVVVIVGSALMLLFLGFELWFSALYPIRAQNQLLQSYRTLALGGAATVEGWSPTPGEGIAILDIPRLGLNQVVVEGTTADLLKDGPGHFRATPLPGELGNVVIAGRHTTYGGPFQHLASLTPGDPINLTTAQGQFTYLVKAVSQVTPGQPDVLGSTDSARLTLVTANEPYAPTGRYVVTAALSGTPLRPVARPALPVSSDESGFSGNRAAIGPVLLWGELLVMTIGLMWWLLFRRRFSGRVTWMLGTPIALALMVVFFENVSRLLPATL